jgi:hypothetical protein
MVVPRVGECSIKEEQPIKEDNFIDFMMDVIYSVLRVLAWVAYISIIIVSTYEFAYIFMRNNIPDDYTYVTNNFYVDKDSDTNEVEILNDFVETLPPIFIKEFRKNWRVVIGDNILPTNELPDTVTIGGYTDWNSRTIFVRNQPSITDTLDIFVHELGHCFDFEYGSASYSNLFNDIYNLYKDTFDEQYTNSPEGYSTSSAVEFFATCFKEYKLCPDHLNAAAPKAYDFIDHFYKDTQKIKYMYMYDLGAVANIVSRFDN